MNWTTIPSSFVLIRVPNVTDWILSEDTDCGRETPHTTRPQTPEPSSRPQQHQQTVNLRYCKLWTPAKMRRNKSAIRCWWGRAQRPASCIPIAKNKNKELKQVDEKKTQIAFNWYAKQLISLNYSGVKAVLVL